MPKLVPVAFGNMCLATKQKSRSPLDPADSLKNTPASTTTTLKAKLVKAS